MLPHSYSFSAIGTSWRIDSGQVITNDLKRSITERIEYFDSIYSRFRPDSLVSRLANRSGVYQFPEDVEPLISLYRQLYDITGHQVTPLIGRTLERAGYDATYSFISRPQEPVPDWDEVMQWQARTVTTTTPLLLDFGAAGKGYLVDLLTALLHQAGIGQFVIDGSGDLYVHDDVPQRVGLEDPSDPTQVVGIVEVSGASLCASAGNRRSWGEGMHHIINPQTQRPVQDITATWTIASTAAQADGLATALFFVPPQQLLAEFAFQYIRLFRNGTIEYSNDLQGEIFS